MKARAVLVAALVFALVVLAVLAWCPPPRPEDMRPDESDVATRPYASPGRR